jgi:hypothetical protein
VVILLTFTGCKDPTVFIKERRSPENFPGSTWSTENGEISFYVTEEYSLRFRAHRTNSDGTKTYGLDLLSTNIYGKIMLGEEQKEFFLTKLGYNGRFVWILVSEDMPYEGDEDLFYDEIFHEYSILRLLVKYKKNRCTATVDHGVLPENNFFPDGTEFEFFRTDI